MPSTIDGIKAAIRSLAYRDTEFKPIESTIVSTPSCSCYYTVNANALPTRTTNAKNGLFKLLHKLLHER